MNWNEEKQARFNELRGRELKGQLSAGELSEFTELVELIEQEEAQYLGPTVARMEMELTVMRERLQNIRSDNEELAKLLNQQEEMAIEARRWLADFKKRHEQIRSTYTQLTGEVLPTT